MDADEGFAVTNETVELTTGTSLYMSKRKADVPRNAIKSGLSPCGNVYVGIVCHKDEIMPAKIIPAYNLTYYAYKGKEYSTSEKTYLVVDPGYKYDWVPASQGETPVNSAVVGMANGQEPFYIGRVPIDSEKCVGKILKSHRVCYVPKCGREYPFIDYDVLVISKMPKTNNFW